MKTIYAGVIQSYVDVITNSSSELYISTPDSKQPLNELSSLVRKTCIPHVSGSLFCLYGYDSYVNLLRSSECDLYYIMYYDTKTQTFDSNANDIMLDTWKECVNGNAELKELMLKIYNDTASEVCDNIEVIADDFENSCEYCISGFLEIVGAMGSENVINYVAAFLAKKYENVLFVAGENCGFYAGEELEKLGLQFLGRL